MKFKDNLVLINDKTILFINLVSYRRKKVQYKHKDMVLSIIDKEKGNNNFNDEELSFIKELEEEKQILNKDLDSLVKKELLSYYGDSMNDNRIRPSIVLSYECNSNCIYCYQKGKKLPNGKINVDYIDKIDEFYNKYSENFPLKNKNFVIYLTGGEPLLDSNITTLKYIFEKWDNAKFEIATNGINITKFIDYLPIDKIKEFDISLDGDRDTHNKRRPMRNGDKSFDRIVQGIEMVIEKGIPVNLKVTSDKNSILYLTNLLDFLEKKDWLNNPLIKIGISCVFSFKEGIKLDEKFNTRTDIINSYIEMKKCDKRMRNIEPNFMDGIGTLNKIVTRKQNSRVMPGIYCCENLFTPSYTFDPSGNVYFCVALTGNDKGKVGTFYPEVNIDYDVISKLRERHIYQMNECEECSYKFICRGGCPASTILQYGNLMKSDCGFYQDEFVMDKLGQIIL